MRQPLWNKYETALLIEAFWKIKTNSSQKDLIVSELSSTLRKMATFDIDEVFRNENGIRLRLGELNSLFFQETDGLKNTSNLFREMVELYVSNRDEFESILLEAKKMANDICKKNENAYMNWLSQQVSPAQLSELYQTYKVIDHFMVYTKIVSESIFETFEYKKILKIKQTVESNKAFRFQNRASFKKCISAMTYLAKSLRPDDPNEDVWHYWIKGSYGTGKTYSAIVISKPGI